MKPVLTIYSLIVFFTISPYCFGQTNNRPADERIKRIILVTLDTVRADHLGFMGYPRNTSPFLDQLSARGFLFKNAFTVIPFTPSSHASIFTSLYPQQHKVDARSPLDERCTTMAEYLKKKGYMTAAFVSCFAMTQKLKRGFDRFDPSKPTNAADYTRRAAAGTINNAIAWLSGKSTGDFIFLWIHLFDAHRPYEKDINCEENFRDSVRRKNQLVRYWTREQGIELDFYREDKRENLFLTMNRYDGEIQRIDSELKRFYDFMETTGLNNNSLWIVTSDHGEGLGSHFFYNHQRIYNEQLRAPIIFYEPGRKKGLIIEDLVENIDILPTLSELVGFSLLDSPFPVEGRSLVPFMQGKQTNHREYVFSMSGTQSLEKCKIFKKEDTEMLPIDGSFLHCDDTGRKFSLQDGNNKYIYNSKGDEFYNLRTDPNERNNLISVASRKKDKMKKILTCLVEKLEKARSLQEQEQSKSKAADALHEESLKALGY